MEVTAVGNHLCSDTLEALRQLSDVGADTTFGDILSCHADLKVYLDLRNSSEVHAEIRGTECLGVSCFACEDGAVTLDTQAVSEK